MMATDAIGGYRHGNVVEQALQVALGLDRLSLGALSFLDVDGHAVPFDDSACFVAREHTVNGMPPIHSVCPSQPHLCAEWQLGAKTPLPFFKHARGVLRVNGACSEGINGI